MTWRWVPPVLSPVNPGSLIAGAATALGLLRPYHDVIAGLVLETFGARDVLLTDSGTSALVIALRATVPKGGAVAMPGYACIDLIAAARLVGVKVRFYDTDPKTLSPDFDSLQDAIARGSDAVVVAPLYGYPVDMVGVHRVAAANGVPVIEDAAQSAGAMLNGKRIGHFGHMSVLSFGRGKGTTGGSGGALLVHNVELLDSVRAANDLGRPQRGVRDVVALGAQWLLARPMLYALPSSIPSLRLGEMVYHAPQEPGALSLAAGRILGSAFRADPDEVRARRARAAQLIDIVSRCERFDAVRAIPGGTPGYLRLALLDARGDGAPSPRIGALRGYPVTLDEHPETQPVLAAGERAGAGAHVLRDRLFTLPTHSRMNRDDVGRLATWLGASAVDESGPVATPSAP